MELGALGQGQHLAWGQGELQLFPLGILILSLVEAGLIVVAGSQKGLLQEMSLLLCRRKSSSWLLIACLDERDSLGF